LLNRSQDDPLVLYAAMFGGINTYFVSRDLMRGHKFKLGDLELGRLFKRWQLARQYHVHGSIMQKTARIYVRFRIVLIYQIILITFLLMQAPVTTLPYSQRTGDSWHVPFHENPNSGLSKYSFPKKWLCIRRQ